MQKQELDVYLDGVGQRDGDSERQALWDGHHQHGHSDDEEFDKVLNVDGSALCQPRLTCNTDTHQHRRCLDSSGTDVSSKQRANIHKYTPSTTNVLMTKYSTSMMTVMADITKPAVGSGELLSRCGSYNLGSFKVKHSAVNKQTLLTVELQFYFKGKATLFVVKLV